MDVLLLRSPDSPEHVYALTVYVSSSCASILINITTYMMIPSQNSPRHPALMNNLSYPTCILFNIVGCVTFTPCLSWRWHTRFTGRWCATWRWMIQANMILSNIKHSWMNETCKWDKTSSWNYVIFSKLYWYPIGALHTSSATLFQLPRTARLESPSMQSESRQLSIPR